MKTESTETDNNAIEKQEKVRRQKITPKSRDREYRTNNNAIKQEEKE